MLEYIAGLVDWSKDCAREDGARRAIEVAAKLREGGALTDEQNSELLYFEANAWHVLQPARMPGNADAWSWTDEAMRNEIRLLRLAQRSRGFVRLNALRQSQIYTNLANAMDTLGRYVEAIELYERAIELNPDHGMAFGNLGACLENYGQLLIGMPHSEGTCDGRMFLVRAWSHSGMSFRTAVDPEAAKDFAARYYRLRPVVEHWKENPGRPLGEGRPGDTEQERCYREWCLANRLFLHPLNDLDPFPEAAADPIHLPPIIDHSDRGLTLHGLLNQIKQEYVTSRLLLYEGLQTETTHFADRKVSLVNTLDYSVYSIPLEKVRISFRTTYSLFDKLGIFLNEYLGLGMTARSASFRWLWYQGELQKNGVKPYFQTKANWPLRGLFGLSRDLCGSKTDQDALDPDARDLVGIRNHIEHKHLKVHDEGWIACGRGTAGESADGGSFAIDRETLEARALRMMKLARSALIYLVHGVWFEEVTRASSRGEGVEITPMIIDIIDDNWKR